MNQLKKYFHRGGNIFTAVVNNVTVMPLTCTYGDHVLDIPASFQKWFEPLTLVSVYISDSLMFSIINSPVCGYSVVPYNDLPMTESIVPTCNEYRLQFGGLRYVWC